LEVAGGILDCLDGSGQLGALPHQVTQYFLRCLLLVLGDTEQPG
jgi:hypothetical protein